VDGHPIYRRLLHLYPASFRRRYGPDLVQHFSDLVADRGVRAAWARTFVDLTVTVPRYRLENVMNEQHSAAALGVAIGAFAVVGVLSLLMGVYPGLVMLAVAVALAAGRRAELAQALRIPDSSRRRRRLRTAAVLAVVFGVAYTAYTMLIGDEWTVRETVLTAVGVPAMIGAVGFGIAGLLTPRSTDEPAVAPTS
jgi:hypothetical protein